jgi:hypothetical protein
MSVAMSHFSPRVRAAISVAALAAASLGVGATAAHAATTDGHMGGCTTHKASGFSVGSCIGVTAFIAQSDIYVNSVGNQGRDCFVLIYTVKGKDNVTGTESAPCSKGHYIGDSLSGTGFDVHTEAIVKVDGRTVLTVDSPTAYM